MNGHYLIVDSHTEMGRSYVIIRCTCGTENKVFLWSWAGHGFKRCKQCKRKLSYHSSEVTS